MAKIFTKLNLGDVVASSGGKCFKKLSTEASGLRLNAPTISIDGNILTIIDNSGLATSFDILVDGEVKYTLAKYLYNGVCLPSIPILADYPYAFIGLIQSTGKYQILASKQPMYFADGKIKRQNSNVEPFISCTAGAVGWTVGKSGNYSWSIDTDRILIWSNHDIPNGSADATDIYFEGTEPVQSDVGLTSATFDLTTLGLEFGTTYSISAISKAEGYKDSAESEAVSYKEQSILGEWLLNKTLTFPTNSVKYYINFTAIDNYGSSGNFIAINLIPELSSTTKNYMQYTFNASDGSEAGRSIYTNGTWGNDASRTITIKGGDGTSNADFIAWLQANATKVS